jgi:uncharacterized protein
MTNKFGVFVAIAIAACARIALAAGDVAQPIPELVARVTDATNTLTAQQESALSAKLAALEQRKGAQIAVLIVPTTSPETVEQYATRVFDQWKLGRKGVDDGVLILVAKNDRRERIEVAYGLEGAIPDAAAKRVAHDYMSPKFRAGDFAGGIDAGVDMLTHLIDEEPLPPPQSQSRVPAQGHAIPEPWWSPVQFVGGMFLGAILAVLLVLVLAWPRIYRVVLGRIPERARSYVFGAIVAAPLTLLLRHPMASLGAFAAGGTLAAMVGLSKPPSRRPRGFAGGGGSSSGGSSGDSGSSSSGSSGGDFSGGGGSSGGGGASDSW